MALQETEQRGIPAGVDSSPDEPTRNQPKTPTKPKGVSFGDEESSPIRREKPARLATSGSAFDLGTPSSRSTPSSRITRHRSARQVLEADSEGQDRFCKAQFDYTAQLIFMSTLLLGFCLTGTMISVQFTGEQPWRVNNIIHLAHCNLASVLLSAFSLAVAFGLYSQGSQIYGVKGPHAAYAFFVRYLALALMAEIGVILSIIPCFLSLSDFFQMNYVGPDICPQSHNMEQLRTSTKCSLLGSDFMQAADTMCAGYTCGNGDEKREPSFNRVCDARCKYLDEHLMEDTWWFGWNAGPQSGYGMSWKWDSQERHQLMNDLSEAFCHKEELEASMLNLCNSATAGPALMQDSFLQVKKTRHGGGGGESILNVAESNELGADCARMFRAWNVARTCKAGTITDANTCFKVCHWTGSPLISNMTVVRNIYLLDWVIGVCFLFIILRRARSFLR